MTTQAIDDLDDLRLPELRERFIAVVGEPTRCPNRHYLIRRIREALRANPQRTRATLSPTLTPVTAVPTEPRVEPLQQVRGRFASLTIEELQQKYTDVVGRPTSSVHRAYLRWKIREAERGRVRTGPRVARERRAPVPTKVLPLRLEVEVIERMDAAWRAHGIKNRTTFLRTALGAYLERLGSREASALLNREF